MNQAAAIHSLPYPYPPARPSLREDTRGAVMVTGLFMAFFLVGALWFVIGIGDAVIFRDRMQEAADHAAFTSAALHAKGMNFISAVNIIMLLMVVVHIVLGIIHDFALAACILSLGTACGGWSSARKIYETYSNTIMKPALTGMHYVEVAAAVGYPWLGTWKGSQTGGKYGNQGRVGGVSVVALGPSNIPAGVIGSAVGVGGTLGLPVVAEPMDYLCIKFVDKIFDFAKEFAQTSLGLVGQIVSTVVGAVTSCFGFCGGGGETIMDIVERLVASGVQLRYCNSLGTTNPAFYTEFQRGRSKLDEENTSRASNVDSNGNPTQPQIERPQTTTQSSGAWSATLDPGFDQGWGSDGPLVVAHSGGNGTQAQSVWATNRAPTYQETSDKRVKLGRGPTAGHGGLSQDTSPLTIGGASYTAQAEFYFDCTETWTGDDCDAHDANASFSIRWRARLRRTSLFSFNEMLANFAVEGVLGSDAVGEAVDGLLGNGLDSLVGTNGPLSAVGVNALRNWLDYQIQAFGNDVQDAAAGAAGGGGVDSRVYH